MNKKGLLKQLKAIKKRPSAFYWGPLRRVINKTVIKYIHDKEVRDAYRQLNPNNHLREYRARNIDARLIKMAIDDYLTTEKQINSIESVMRPSFNQTQNSKNILNHTNPKPKKNYLGTAAKWGFTAAAGVLAFFGGFTKKDVPADYTHKAKAPVAHHMDASYMDLAKSDLLANSGSSDGGPSVGPDASDGSDTSKPHGPSSGNSYSFSLGGKDAHAFELGPNSAYAGGMSPDEIAQIEVEELKKFYKGDFYQARTPEFPKERFKFRMQLSFKNGEMQQAMQNEQFYNLLGSQIEKHKQQFVKLGFDEAKPHEIATVYKIDGNFYVGFTKITPQEYKLIESFNIK